MRTHTCAHAHTHAHRYARIHIDIDIHIHIHTHIHIDIDMRAQASRWRRSPRPMCMCMCMHPMRVDVLPAHVHVPCTMCMYPVPCAGQPGEAIAAAMRIEPLGIRPDGRYVHMLYMCTCTCVYVHVHVRIMCTCVYVHMHMCPCPPRRQVRTHAYMQMHKCPCPCPMAGTCAHAYVHMPMPMPDGRLLRALLRACVAARQPELLTVAMHTADAHSVSLHSVGDLVLRAHLALTPPTSDLTPATRGGVHGGGVHGGDLGAASRLDETHTRLDAAIAVYGRARDEHWSLSVEALRMMLSACAAGSRLISNDLD